LGLAHCVTLPLFRQGLRRSIESRVGWGGVGSIPASVPEEGRRGAVRSQPCHAPRWKRRGLAGPMRAPAGRCRGSVRCKSRGSRNAADSAPSDGAGERQRSSRHGWPCPPCPGPGWTLRATVGLHARPGPCPSDATPGQRHAAAWRVLLVCRAHAQTRVDWWSVVRVGGVCWAAEGSLRQALGGGGGVVGWVSVVGVTGDVSRASGTL